ncbi:MAG: hypothetical protein GY715_10190 [Planctomycetes bacterium]|nr:hypothetical protein [Planctomycetota bacterium]
MPAVSRPKQIDVLMEKASKALTKTDYFEAEEIAARALGMARDARDFERMARIILPLQEARRQRTLQALDAGTITLPDAPVAEDAVIEPGCYLIQPPQVGADARRLRLRAIQRRIPVAVVCREPLTQIRLYPIVAIAPGVTVRTKIDPPADPEAPDLEWFVGAMNELGEFAVESLDQALTTIRRLDALLGRLEAIPESEKLHQALEETCRLAASEEQADGEAPPRTPRRTRR